MLVIAMLISTGCARKHDHEAVDAIQATAVRSPDTSVDNLAQQSKSIGKTIDRLIQEGIEVALGAFLSEGRN